MMLCSYDALTQEVVEMYGNRKKPGRLSVVVDTTNGLVFPVPLQEEHIHFVQHSFVDRLVSRGLIVPSHIQLEPVDSIDHVVGVLTGVSGMEQGYGITHDHSSLQKAHDQVWLFITQGQYPIGPVRENRIVFNPQSEPKSEW